MGTLYLVRHGQASFGAENYDQLSPLGAQQCQQLGRYFLAKGRQFDAVITGTLVRHGQSLAAIVDGMGGQLSAVAQLPVLQLAGLNEYDSHAVIAAVHPQPLAKPDTPELYRHHFRLLRQGLSAWMGGQTQPQGMQLRRLCGRCGRSAGPCAQPMRWGRVAGVQRRADFNRRRPGAGHARCGQH